MEGFNMVLKMTNRARAAKHKAFSVVAQFVIASSLPAGP
jgi:hypothetical protein